MEWRNSAMTDWRSLAGMKLMVDGELVSKCRRGSAGTGVGWLTGTRRVEQRVRLVIGGLGVSRV